MRNLENECEETCNDIARQEMQEAGVHVVASPFTDGIPNPPVCFLGGMKFQNGTIVAFIRQTESWTIFCATGDMLNAHSQEELNAHTHALRLEHGKEADEPPTLEELCGGSVYSLGV